jgi:D-glycero-D-manno-heptose 1,7-bisphosphate phosphatase
MEMNKTIFLDRDGTVIQDMVYLNDPHQIHYYDDSFTALRRLHLAGYLLILVTNQSGVARGLVQMENLLKINELIRKEYEKNGISIADIFYCPHAVDAGCECRKPKPGMLLEGAKKFDIDLTQSWMIGDRMSDIEAGKAVGCQSILLEQNRDQKQTRRQSEDEQGFYRCESLSECASLILTKSNPLIAEI